MPLHPQSPPLTRSVSCCRSWLASRGCGRRARSIVWALRGPRGDPRRGGHVDRGVLRSDRHPERSWRRWPARVRAGWPAKGPWPRPVGERVEPIVVKHAEAHTAWAHRKVWAMTRYDGEQVSASTVLRVRHRRGLVTEAAAYQRERRQLAAARWAAFLTRRPARTRCGSWTSPSLRPRPAGGLALRRVRGLPAQVRVRLAAVTHRQPARRDRRGRARPR